MPNKSVRPLAEGMRESCWRREHSAAALFWTQCQDRRVRGLRRVRENCTVLFSTPWIQGGNREAVVPRVRSVRGAAGPSLPRPFYDFILGTFHGFTVRDVEGGDPWGLPRSKYVKEGQEGIYH